MLCVNMIFSSLCPETKHSNEACWMMFRLFCMTQGYHHQDYLIKCSGMFQTRIFEVLTTLLIFRMASGGWCFLLLYLLLKNFSFKVHTYKKKCRSGAMNSFMLVTHLPFVRFLSHLLYLLLFIHTIFSEWFDGKFQISLFSTSKYLNIYFLRIRTFSYKAIMQ